MSEPHITRVLDQQRRRMIAAIMGHAERSFFDRLTHEEQQAFRNNTLAAIGVYCDLVRDIVKVSNDDVVLNTEVLELVQAMHSNQHKLIRDTCE